MKPIIKTIEELYGRREATGEVLLDEMAECLRRTRIIAVADLAALMDVDAHQLNMAVHLLTGMTKRDGDRTREAARRSGEASLQGRTNPPPQCSGPSLRMALLPSAAQSGSPIWSKARNIVRMLTLSEGKGSASFGAGPLFVDGGYCGDVCSIWYQVVQSSSGAALLGTEWRNLAALLLCSVRSGAILQRCCSARYGVVQSRSVAAPLGTQRCFIYSIIEI